MDSNDPSQNANRSFIFVIIVLCDLNDGSELVWDNLATKKHPVSQRICSVVTKTGIQGSSARLPGSLMYRSHLLRLSGLLFVFFLPVSQHLKET